jgi:nucleotide-binding universal stress UspA family protein
MRLLLAIDQLAPSQAVVDFAAGFAVESGAAAWVLHVRELPYTVRTPALETAAESDELVQEAVMSLRQARVSAGGRSVSAQQRLVAHRIAEEGLLMASDLIVVGSQRLTGLRRISGRGGLRDRLLKLSSLPVLVAPPPLQLSARSLRSLPDACGGEHRHEPPFRWRLNDGGRR